MVAGMDDGVRFEPCGKLVGHGDWVTSIAAPQNSTDRFIVSGSRDKKIMVWKLNETIERADNEDAPGPGHAHKALTGHGQCVQDVAISADGAFALSGSWDKQLRLWDLNVGKSVRRFVGHTSDVNSVAFSACNRQIVSGSRDRTIRLWNTLAECKYVITQDQHTDWVSTVRFSPSGNTNPVIVSCGWDKILKVWRLPDCKLQTNLVGHTLPLYTLTISPDSSLCASGGKDGVAMLWEVNAGHHLYSLESGAPIQALCFSPCNYWLCAATGRTIKIWDLENKGILGELAQPKQLAETNAKNMKSKKFQVERTWCTSLAWSADGMALFAGATDGCIYVYKVAQGHGAVDVDSMQQLNN
eukprot:Selendium_serpulae@DN4775_c1_g1_i6.p1